MACAAALIGAAALVSALKPAPSGDSREPTRRLRPLVAGGGTPGSGIRDPGPAAKRAASPSARDSLAGARASARVFLHAFLRYQAGDTSSRTGPALARTASDRVNRYLRAGSARRVGRTPHAEVRSIRLYAPRPGEAKASALLRYGRRQSLFELLLARRGSGWRVTELYP